MNELGIRIGCPTGEIVIVPTHIKQHYTVSTEHRKSIIIIESICADRSPSLPLVIICPGKKIIIESWIYDNLSRADMIMVLQTGYTNENITITWLNHFIKHVDAGPKEH